MPDYKLSALAEADLGSLTRYTIQTWGVDQARLYASKLRDTIAQIAANPMLGRSSEKARTNYRRIEQGSHVIFYRVRSDGDILVSRILHKRMLPRKHLFEDF